jgi:Delta7-sterol 5-desaturase
VEGTFLEQWPIWQVMLIGSLILLLINSLRYAVFSYGAHLLIYRVTPEFLRRRLVLGQPMNQDVSHDIRHSMVTVGIYTLMTIAMLYLFLHGYTQIYFDPAERGWVYFAFSILALFVMHDAYFFWAHYLLHRRALFKRVHYVHHLSRNPTPVASHSFHPMEAVVEAGVYPLAVLIIPVNIWALVIFFALMFFIVSYGHSGVDLVNRRVASSAVGRWIATSTHHTLHHRTARYNLGLYFTWWDRLMGTLHPEYEENLRP